MSYAAPSLRGDDQREGAQHHTSNFYFVTPASKKSMMHVNQNNYAFIDGQNLYLGIQGLGWKLDYARLRIYLREKYGISVAYMFLGYVADNQRLYSHLQKCGYVLVFKPVIPDVAGHVKGNVDADLVLQIMLDYPLFNQALISQVMVTFIRW